MIGIDLMGADATAADKARGAIKSAAPGAVDLLFDTIDNKKPKDDKGNEKKDEKKGEKGKKKEGHEGDDEPGFFSRAIVGPVKVWHALVGVVAAGGGVWWWRSRGGKKS